MKAWFWLLLFLPLSGYSQISIDKAGDGWHLKIDSALTLISQYDSAKYELLNSVCSKIEFWNGCYSTNDGEEVIIVAAEDVKLGSINNLASVLIHESLHLYLMDRGVEVLSNVEENYCYRYELEFLKKLPNPEPWLISHAIEQIEATQ